MNRMDLLFIALLLVCGVVVFWSLFGSLVWREMTK